MSLYKFFIQLGVIMSKRGNIANNVRWTKVVYVA